MFNKVNKKVAKSSRGIAIAENKGPVTQNNSSNSDGLSANVIMWAIGTTIVVVGIYLAWIK